MRPGSRGDCQAYAAMAPLKRPRPAAGHLYFLSAQQVFRPVLWYFKRGAASQHMPLLCMAHACQTLLARLPEAPKRINIAACLLLTLTPGAQDGQGRLMLHRPAPPPLARRLRHAPRLPPCCSCLGQPHCYDGAHASELSK